MSPDPFEQIAFGGLYEAARATAERAALLTGRWLRGLRASAKARIERRAVVVPAALLPHEGHEVVDIRFGERIFVGRHARPTVADFRLHRGVVHGLAGNERGVPIEVLELRRPAGEVVMAEPALVIENLPPAFRPAPGGLPELVDFERALVIVPCRRLRVRPGSLRGLLRGGRTDAARCRQSSSQHRRGRCRPRPARPHGRPRVD